jgi:outer membrane lipoprotein-sorting protein
MNQDQPIDDLVRAHLDRLGRASEPRAGLERIRATLAQPAPRSRRWLRRGLSAAAVLLIALLAGTLYIGSAQATNEALVRAALAKHAQPIDRCYDVEHQREANPDERAPLRTAARQSKLWTRGDRFWIESQSRLGKRQWNWGRDQQGRLWLALTQHRAIRYEAGETPEYLALVCDVYSMKIETLLVDVLADFDLQRVAGADGVYVIQAELKPGRTHPSLRSARLEIDAETKELRRVELERTFRGRHITTTFTLVETRTFDVSKYELDGHLREPHQIFSREFQPERRRGLAFGLFGAREP